MSNPFYVGQKVVAVDTSIGKSYIKGEVYVVRRVNGTDSISTVKDANGSTTNGWGVGKFKPLYEKGLQLFNEDHDYSKTIVAIDGTYVVTKDDDDGTLSVWDMESRDKLKAYNWLPKGKEEEVTEFTLKEVAEKFNINVDKLRIKD